MVVEDRALSKRQVRDLLDLMEEDVEMRRQMSEVLRIELLGSRKARESRINDVGRLRR
jgi:hypothetical protein